MYKPKQLSLVALVLLTISGCSKPTNTSFVGTTEKSTTVEIFGTASNGQNWQYSYDVTTEKLTCMINNGPVPCDESFRKLSGATVGVRF